MKRSVHPRLMCAVFAATVAPSLHADDSRDRHGGESWRHTRSR